ncbi:MAG: hypothetical protein ACREHE_14105 [Rhizomicrobium sp.]
MATKIPVGDTISRSFAFGFRNYLPLLGIIWLPMVAMLAIVWFGYMPYFVSLTHAIELQAQNPQIMPMAGMPNMGVMMLLQLAILFCYVWMGAGATKLALGLRSATSFVYLPGKDEVTLAITYVVLFIIWYIAMIVFAIVCAIVVGAVAIALGVSGANLDPSTNMGIAAAAVVLGIAFVVAYFYGIIRLMFLIQPAVIMSKKIDVMGSWNLMKGNVLRAFVIVLVMVLPLIVLEIVLFAVAGGAALSQLLHQDFHAMKPDQAVAMFTGLWLHVLPFAVIAGFLLGPLAMGFMQAPAALAYRALVPPKPPEGASAA